MKAVFDRMRPKVSVTSFAAEIGRSRKNVYELFESPTIDSGVLRKMGKALGHDFFQYLGPDGKANTVAEEQAPYGTKKPVRPTQAAQPLQVVVNIDPNDPDAARKFAEIMRIVNGD